MKLLVLSDSHSSLHFMRMCIDAVKPNGIIHLGDHFDDGQVIAQENPHLVVHQVPGNCDRYRCPINTPQTLCYPIGGVKLFMTHGHMHFVKQGNGALLADARRSGAQAVLYGHTHRAVCAREEDGLWVLNPGSCGSCGGSAGLIEIEEQAITRCSILTQQDLEAMR